MAAAVLTREQVENMSEAIERRLWSHPSLRSDDMPIRFVLHRDGSVHVKGNVRSNAIKMGALELIGSIGGVDQIIDHVYTDPNLERAVAKKLLTDSRTAHIPPGMVQLFGHQGVIVLVGEIATRDDIQAVLDVASSVEGVQEVINRLMPSA